jgi:hypothetical protein
MNNQDNQKPSYFAILPSTVRYDKRLKPIERIFFAEITALANKRGFCNASNGYFAKVFEVSKTTASRYISNLVKFNYIYSEIERDSNNTVIARRMYPLMNAQNIPINSSTNTPIAQTINTPIAQLVNTPIAQTSKYNNTSNNNTSNNISGNAIFSNNFNKFDNEQENEYIDFRPLAKEGKIGLLGKAKAICQDKLSYLTFDNFDNKKLSDILGSIKANLNAYNKQNNITARVTDESVLKAFKTALNSILNKSEETPSLAYVKSCLTPSLYLDNQSKETGKDYSQFLNVVKSKFKHYQKFTPQDIRDLERIIEALKEKGGSDLENFKELFNNLPQWILDKRYYQSISFVAKKIDELKQVYSLDELARQNENFNALKEWKGEEEALRLIKKVLLKNASNS